MNIIIEEEKFLPHCGCQIHLRLEKNKINVIKGVNGVGKTTLAHLMKERYFKDLTLIEQNPLQHFYQRRLIELKNIFIAAKPQHFDLETLNRLWKMFDLERINLHSVKQLSGGENQSLKLAFGLSIKNSMIIIDEPSQYLDVHRKKQLTQFLAELMINHFVIIIEHEGQWLEHLPQKICELRIEDKMLKASYV